MSDEKPTDPTVSMRDYFERRLHDLEDKLHAHYRSELEGLTVRVEELQGRLDRARQAHDTLVELVGTKMSSIDYQSWKDAIETWRNTEQGMKKGIPIGIALGSGAGGGAIVALLAKVFSA